MKEKLFAKWKNGERQVRSEREGLCVSWGLGLILEITGRDLSSGRTRSPFGLRKGPLWGMERKD